MNGQSELQRIEMQVRWWQIKSDRRARMTPEESLKALEKQQYMVSVAIASNIVATRFEIRTRVTQELARNILSLYADIDSALRYER